MASPEGKKGSGGQQQQQNRHHEAHHKRKSHGVASVGSVGAGGDGGSGSGGSPHGQLSLRAPVIRHRDASAPVVISGWLFKQGSDGLMLWKKRWFVLSQYCLFYYHGPEEEKVLGSLLLPGYTIRPCLAGDRDRFVYRKYAFKAEHRNTRSFYLAAESRPAMIQWMNALSLAAILQDQTTLTAAAAVLQSSSFQRDESSTSGSAAAAAAASGHRQSKAEEKHQRKANNSSDASFESDHHATTGRQPLYANAPPKPRRALNTSRDSVCSSSPDASPERPRTPPSAMYSNQKQQVAAVRRTNGHQWPAHLQQQQQQQRPLSAEVTDLLHQQRHHRPSSAEVAQLANRQQQQQQQRNSPQQQHHLPAERRTPDAYGRFKTEYEDVYNNSTTSASSGSSQMVASTSGYAVARSEVARRVPPRPHSVDFLQQQQQQAQQQEDYWASEEDYARQVRQSSVMRNNSNGGGGRGVARDPAEISRDIKESALWSYVQGANSKAKAESGAKLTAAASQDNLLAEPPAANNNNNSNSNNNNNQQLFHRSASARLPRVAKQPDLLNSSLADPTSTSPVDNKRCEQREESMKRLLEWKQRMLQSPLTRKNAGSGSGTRSSERSTPTLAERDTASPRIINRVSSPVQQQQQHHQQHPQPQQQGPVHHADYANNMNPANFATLRRTMARAAQDLLDQEQLYQQQQQQQQQNQQQQFNLALRASLKRPELNAKIPMQLDEEDEVRKEFTYEYVFSGGAANNDSSPAESEVTSIPKVVWPRQSLMREKSSAVADLRARSESPSANRVLFTKEIGQPAKSRPQPPPKPKLLNESNHAKQLEQEKRLSYAESLPESLAGFAATIVSEDGADVYEPTVSPLISECDWPHNTTNGGPSPAPLPDLMSLSSAKENLYVNAVAPILNSTATEDALNQSNIVEDHYLPMTSTKLSLLNQAPSPASVSMSVSFHFEENAYVEMTDSGKIKSSPPGQQVAKAAAASSSVFAGVFDPSYRSPESPRYTEIEESRKPADEDQPHYEFIYKASSHAEPVYMEVPQAEEEQRANEPNQNEEPPVVNSNEMVAAAAAVSHSRQSSLIDTSMLNESKLEEQSDLMIVPPRHPRFSISDTFRPASFFLQNKLATIPSEEAEASLSIAERIDESSDSELVSPPPIPASPADLRHRASGHHHHHHGRSQSLDITQDYNPPPGRTSRNSLSSEVSLCNLSRRRPLTIVRSLEDLLVDASDEQLAEMSGAIQPGSMLSLASNNQPLYENLASPQPPIAPPVAQHSRQASRISRMSTSPAGSIHSAQRQRLGSALSINSTASNSSVTRSEQSAGAPYYYSDLLGGGKVAAPEECGSVRSSSSRGAQAAKQAYQHSMDRLRMQQQRQRCSPPESRIDPGGAPAVATPTLRSQSIEPRQLIAPPHGRQQRSQTPDLLANHPGEPAPSIANRSGEVMRRVRSLEGLLDEDLNHSLQTTAGGSTANGLEVRYAKDPTSQHRTLPRTMPEALGSPEFSPWDEDQLWRDKLRRASIRHTRSMDMLDEINDSFSHHHNHYQHNNNNNNNSGSGRSSSNTMRPRTKTKPEPVPEDPGDCYERLLQYSATLERTKRGQTYLDGYTWDEREQRFRRPGSEAAAAKSATPQSAPKSSPSPSTTEGTNHFLEQGLPPPTFEIDREKLRQWDLMSTAAVPDVAHLDAGSIKEGGRRTSIRSVVQHAVAQESHLRQPDLTATSPGGSSPVQAVAAGLSHATSGAAGKAFNGIRVAYHQSGLSGKVTSSAVVTTQPAHRSDRPIQQQHQQQRIYHPDNDPPPKKGKLPPMIGHDQPVGQMGHDGNQVPLSAGDLLGRTHEELVLLLIQLRRQSSALVKARDACLLEMESQVKLASLDMSHRQECLARTNELKHHVKELEKQLEKLKPLISLVDNMVKLGSMSPQKQRRTPDRMPEASTAVKRNLTPLLHQQQQQQQQHQSHQKQQPLPSQHQVTYDSPTYTNLQLRSDTVMFHSTPTTQGWEEAQISQLESKHHQLAQLEKFVREEGAAIQRLTRNQQVLRLAIRGIRQQTNGALQKCDYPEVDRCRQQQMFLERELSQIHSLLALSSKRLEDAAVEISRIEREISSLHQQLHRSGSGRATAGSHSLNRSGREMAWLEAELSRVQQHVSQLQTRRQELSSQVNRLTSAEFFLDPEDGSPWTAPHVNGGQEAPKRKATPTWCETDMDSLSTVERASKNDDSAVYANTSGYFSYQPDAYSDHYQPQSYQENYYQSYSGDDDGAVDINEADERMKRYYGIVPKTQQPTQQQLNGGGGSSGPSSMDRDKAEIRTVRIVKRESEKRQRDKTKPRSPCDDNSFSMDELAEEEPVNGHQQSEDPIMDDPVLSQFSHILTLPRGKAGKDGSGKRSPSQRNSIALHESTSTSLAPDQWKGSLRPRRNLSSLSLGDRPEGEDEGPASLDSTQRSPVLTPVYTSAAAREIVEEMRRQDMISARRAVPRVKRRHITISCSQPLALEALTPSKTLRASHGRARDDADLQRALRLQHPFAPDVVRSTISQAIRINEKTIDKLLCTPDKIVIPERYVPEQEVDEPNEEEKQKRLKKTESIRRMLTGSAAVEIPRPPSIAATPNETIELSEAKQLLAKERQQRGHFIELNQVLVEEIKEKSKMAAVHALANMTSRKNSSEEEDWSPPADPLPIYQQRYNYLTVFYITPLMKAKKKT